MALPSGTKLGPYELLSPIGAGGMGEVYRAHDSRLRRQVAVKILLSAFASDISRLRRFEQEARAAAALNHPNILAVHDVGTYRADVSEGTAVLAVAQESPYIVCELLQGETLRERLRAGALSTRKAMDYARQIANGLAAAHDKGIVHRDLKPENIFVTDDGRVKILDFGVAKLMPRNAERDEQTITQTIDSDAGTVLGTVGYMSPEQVRGHTADARSDLFSFGAMLYEMVSGKRAFYRDSAAETMSAILKEDPPELTETARNVSPALERIVRHCLEKSPAERFQSARDVAFDLEMVSGSSTTAAVSSAPMRRARAKKLAVVALVMASLAGGVLLGRRLSTRTTVPSYEQLTFRRGTIREANSHRMVR